MTPTASAVHCTRRNERFVNVCSVLMAVVLQVLPNWWSIHLRLHLVTAHVSFPQSSRPQESVDWLAVLGDKRRSPNDPPAGFARRRRASIHSLRRSPRTNVPQV